MTKLAWRRLSLRFNEATAISCGDPGDIGIPSAGSASFNEATAISCGDPVSDVGATWTINELQRGHSD